MAVVDGLSLQLICTKVEKICDDNGWTKYKNIYLSSQNKGNDLKIQTFSQDVAEQFQIGIRYTVEITKED